LHRLIENLKDRAVYVLDPSGHIASWNEGAQRLTGYAADEIVGEPSTRLWPAQDIVSGKAEQAIAAAAASGTFEDEGWRVRKDGSRFWALTVLTALRDGDGSLTGFSNVLHDITNRKRFEEELLEIEERRQRRIGRDLHDALGQDITGIAFLCKELEEGLAAKGLPEAAEATRIVAEINQAIDRTLALAKGLCPMELTASGLMMALEELALNVEEVFGVPCRFQCEHPVLIYDDVTALHLYRIAQEAVTNAVKHGRPKGVTIGLTAANERYIMRVADDGQGFPAGKPGFPGMGLQIMRYRARSIGGTFSIQRRPEGGTLVLCSVPAGVVGRRLEHGDAGTAATDEGQD
jgi:PAS domain S-box-containing protein